MRALIQGGTRPHVGHSATLRGARRVLFNVARTAVTRRQDPFLTFMDSYDRFVGVQIDTVPGVRC
jgi:hypothetical protein